MSDIMSSTWNNIINRLKGLGAKIQVPEDFKGQVEEIDNILANDKTGLVSTIYDFMVATSTVDFNIVTDNDNLTNDLTNWTKFEVNKNINNDIPRGFRGISEQFLRERWRSSFQIAKLKWDNIDGYEMPSKVWFLESKNVRVENEGDLLKRKYYIPKVNGKAEYLTDSDIGDISYIIRKPYNAWKDTKVTPYLVKKGVIYNALLKISLKDKQADILEEIIPYLLVLKAGDRDLVEKHLLGDLDSQLGKLKDSIRQYKCDYQSRSNAGDSIFKARYDVELEHFLPELNKVFNEDIIRPINLDMLYGLGLIELHGFGTRQEAIMNPKVLFEELTDAVKDLTEFYEEIMAQIIERNALKHPKNMSKNIRIIAKPIKAILTDDLKKMVKDYSNTGQISIEDSFEALPDGFDFEISKMRREKERDNGDEDLFFPRVILNQNGDDYPTRPNATPQEIPQKKKKEKAQKYLVTCLKCNYVFDLYKTPEKSMGITTCPHCGKDLQNDDMIDASREIVEAPYDTVDDLPDNIKNVLPIPAQVIWLRVFNQSIGKGEDYARKVAWTAVKNAGYVKANDGKWHKKK